jgi:hypothetical protein
VELGATRAVVAEQAEAEERLASQAQLLAGSLAMARNDVAGLLAKIGAWVPGPTTHLPPCLAHTTQRRDG